jgi:hypothetical protein
MCDYSLAGVQNRLAVIGDELTVYRFHTGSIGLAPAAALLDERELVKPMGWARLRSAFSRLWRQACGSEVCAVCVPPGARLRVCDIPERLQQELGVGYIEDVTFVQLSAEPRQYRDAVRFSNGSEILLQRLTTGQRAYVLHLGDDVDEILVPASRDLASVG